MGCGFSYRVAPGHGGRTGSPRAWPGARSPRPSRSTPPAYSQEEALSGASQLVGHFSGIIGDQRIQAIAVAARLADSFDAVLVTPAADQPECERGKAFLEVRKLMPDAAVPPHESPPCNLRVMHNH